MDVSTNLQSEINIIIYRVLSICCCVALFVIESPSVGNGYEVANIL